MPDAYMGQELGRLQAEVEALRRDDTRMAESLERIESRLGGIEKTLNEAAGGWRMLVAVGGIAGAVGAGLANAYHWLKGS